jgi:hypothetical protein
VLVAALFALGVPAGAVAQSVHHADLRLGTELSTKPFFVAAGGIGAVAEVPLGGRLRASVVLDVWATAAPGPRTEGGDPTATTELASGVKLELAAPRYFVGVGLGVHGMLARWAGGAYEPGSSFGAGLLSAELFHPIVVLEQPFALSLIPGLSGWFSFGPNGLSTAPDLLPIIRLRALW